jgi:hypothetical protein
MRSGERQGVSPPSAAALDFSIATYVQEFFLLHEEQPEFELGGLTPRRSPVERSRPKTPLLCKGTALPVQRRGMLDLYCGLTWKAAKK